MKIMPLLFQSTQPEWAATYQGSEVFALRHFNPRSPSGLRQNVVQAIFVHNIFQSTQPEWAATIRQSGDIIAVCISIHAARVGCDPMVQRARPSNIISIHAARMGCDEFTDFVCNTLDISIHAARMGCDPTPPEVDNNYLAFQSTQPEWAATNYNPKCGQGLLIFQSTQPEWAATNTNGLTLDSIVISIHAARMGCDSSRFYIY